MNKRSAFYVLLAAVLLIVILKTSVMGERNEKKSALLEEGAIETIMGRKSVRKYLNKPVEEEKITTLLKAGMAAPSGKDTRPWAFVVVTKRAALDSMAAGLPYAKMLIQAPLAIVVCGDPSVSSYWYLDCSAATQNILLAAEALELGAVWTAAYPYEDRMDVVRRYSQLPENLVPLCVIPIGYPDGPQKVKDKYDPNKISRVE
ncbi:nitroreductase family protein [Sanguibacteroides sp. AM78-02pH3A]|uniref:nitroreductase family protein n=1 Tax=Sanguibacteroides sp. AM78-02pH3A TaxID=3002646 RepID=UPI0022E5E7AB|nr:nitroreductase family protein [Sanguibacteroides sp. AM78-02pH3A]